jgi:hypothetical protein
MIAHGTIPFGAGLWGTQVFYYLISVGSSKINNKIALA